MPNFPETSPVSLNPRHRTNRQGFLALLMVLDPVSGLANVSASHTVGRLLAPALLLVTCSQ